MKFTIRVESEDGLTAPRAVGQVKRTGPLQPGTLGLTLSESKALLEGLQREVVQSQLLSYADAYRVCKACGARRAIKDYRDVCFHSLFGGVQLRIPRFYRCRCGSQTCQAQTMKLEGLDRWVAPEFEYIHSHLAATIPYVRTTELLELLLPVDAGNAPSTVRRRTLCVGQRLDAELQKPTGEAHIESSTAGKKGKKPMTIVGLDSGYVHDCRPRSERSFEVVVGRILSENKASRSIGFVRTIETNDAAGHRLKKRLEEQGHTSGHVTVFTDGEPGLRCLQKAALPKATHVLDWYHLTRRFTVLKRVLYGEEAIKEIPTDYHAPLCKALTSMKWRLWHGRVRGAINRIKAFLFTLTTITGKRPAVRLRRLVKELERYLNNNRDSLTNYGRRYRNGQRISTAFMESAVNQLIDKRMSKSQQMRWSPTGAHSLLQVRAELVDGQLGRTFARWYPGFVAPTTATPIAA